MDWLEQPALWNFGGKGHPWVFKALVICAFLFLCHVILLTCNSPGWHWKSCVHHKQREAAREELCLSVLLSCVCDGHSCSFSEGGVLQEEITCIAQQSMEQGSISGQHRASHPWRGFLGTQLPSRFPSAKSCRVSAAPKLLCLFFWERRGLSQIYSLTHVVLVKSSVKNSPHSVFFNSFLGREALELSCLRTWACQPCGSSWSNMINICAPPKWCWGTSYQTCLVDQVQKALWIGIVFHYWVCTAFCSVGAWDSWNAENHIKIKKKWHGVNTVWQQLMTCPAQPPKPLLRTGKPRTSS